MATLIKNARIIDPRANLDICEDIYIDAQRIEIAPSRVTGSPVIMHGKGLIVAPGLIDIHVHFREPGFLYKEDIQSGIRAALSGGVTSALVMPNTLPAIDEAKRVYYQHRRGRAFNFDLMVAAAATRGLNGQELTDIASLKMAGAKAFTDDGKAVVSSEHMEKLLKLCRLYNTLCMQHAEDPHISCGAAIHEGKISEKLGLLGQPSSAEHSIVQRDIELALKIGARYHVLHVSSKESITLLRRAKRHSGLISAEVSPHHLLLCDRDLSAFDANKKMNPPLRSREDQEALLEAARDGTIDAVASDHAPHASFEKRAGLLLAPYGVVGVETAIIALLTLVKRKILSINKAIELMSAGPARVLKEEARIGTLTGPRVLKNACVLDPNFRQVISTKTLQGRSKNSAFIGMEMFGRVVATFQNGHLVYRA